MDQFLRAAEQTGEETEHLVERTERVVGGRLRVREASGDQFAPAARPPFGEPCFRSSIDSVSFTINQFPFGGSFRLHRFG